MSNAYIHDENLKYPNQDFCHMVLKEKYHNYTYDEKFPYRLKGFKYKLIRFFEHIALVILVQPLCYIRYGLKIKGKKYIKEYKKITKRKAMLSICNHTTEWDTLFVSTSRYFHFPEFPAWQEGIESKQGMLYRITGGIPMPIHSKRGVIYAYNAMKDVIKEGKWLHIFPEAACWHFYPAVRPFQRGAFKLAYEVDMPILPMAVKYRKPKGLYKLFKKQPNATLYIGEPIEINKELPSSKAIDDLMVRSHLALVNLLGLDNEEDNAKVISKLPTYKVD